MKTSKHRKGAHSIERVAGNGLLDRRALLSHGAALAGAMGVGGAGTATGAAAEPLVVDPWTLTPGIPVPAYGVPSRFEDKTVRTLTKANRAAAGRARRTTCSTAPLRPMGCTWSLPAAAFRTSIRTSTSF